MANVADPSGSSYPFDPKTNTKLVRGHFFGIDLIVGGWACGQVLSTGPYLGRRHGRRTAFIGSLLDWRSESPPTAGSILGAEFLRADPAQVLSVKAIRAFGWTIDGWAALPDAADFPERKSLPSLGAKIYRGGELVRDATLEDLKSIPMMPSSNFPSLWYRANETIGGTDHETAVTAMYERKAKVEARRAAEKAN